MSYYLITIGCFLVDQILKTKLSKTLKGNEERSILNHNIILKIYHNEGAFLGLLKNKQSILLILNSICVIGLILISTMSFFVKGERLIKAALALITGGALSNIYDRIKRKKVIDYFSFKFKPNLIFNLADMFIFLGTLMIIIKSLFKLKNN